ncbi:MAG: fibrillarin-like rRNA/tRNA 2'-O-methyltransferase [Candidatus Aenigmarchaeota archaeon]|nr:fibrillarin-like rRNA/tRNA 2'-O-methyltransferase [Candidatus Aenigmarchaeota archaeon]
MKEISYGIFLDKSSGKIFTKNLVPGQRVYGESLIKIGKDEYREWVPIRSKLAAAIKKGLKQVPLSKGMKVLYLGSATGTTPSHISDIVGETGIIYSVEFSERMMREFLKLCKQRKNLIPILADARKPSSYEDLIEKVDVVYCDIAQPDETEIAIRNCNMFLDHGEYIMLAVKSRSIDVTKSPDEVYKSEIEKLKSHGVKVMDWKKLDPYEKDHAFILGRF